MSYISISNWDLTEWTDELEALARDKFVPMILGVGATSVDMLRTGDLTFTVVTHYADVASATAAAEKQQAIRQQAAQELPMTLAGTAAGAVFAKG